MQKKNKYQNFKKYDNKLSNLNKGVINNISLNIKANKGILNKLDYIYEYIICINLLYITPSIFILIYFGAFCSLNFYILICNNIPLFLNNILVCSEITWSFDDLALELNNDKFIYNKAINANETIIYSKNHIIEKKIFTNNKYLTIFNFNNSIYIPSCISKNSFPNTLSTNEVVPSRLIIIPYKTNTITSPEVLINHINQKLIKGIEFKGPALGTFSTMREYIKTINDTIVYNEKKILHDLEINTNKYAKMEIEPRSLLIELDTKIRSLLNKCDVHSNHLKKISLILKDIERVNDKKEYYETILDLKDKKREISRILDSRDSLKEISEYQNSEKLIEDFELNKALINAKKVIETSDIDTKELDQRIKLLSEAKYNLEEENLYRLNKPYTEGVAKSKDTFNPEKVNYGYKKENNINVETYGKSVSHVYSIHGNESVILNNQDSPITNVKGNSYTINAQTVNIINNYYSKDSSIINCSKDSSPITNVKGNSYPINAQTINITDNNNYGN